MRSPLVAIAHDGQHPFGLVKDAEQRWRHGDFDRAVHKEGSVHGNLFRRAHDAFQNGSFATLFGVLDTLKDALLAQEVVAFGAAAPAAIGKDSVGSKTGFVLGFVLGFFGLFRFLLVIGRCIGCFG